MTGAEPMALGKKDRKGVLDQGSTNCSWLIAHEKTIATKDQWPIRDQRSLQVVIPPEDDYSEFDEEEEEEKEEKKKVREKSSKFVLKSQTMSNSSTFPCWPDPVRSAVSIVVSWFHTLYSNWESWNYDDSSYGDFGKKSRQLQCRLEYFFRKNLEQNRELASTRELERRVKHNWAMRKILKCVLDSGLSKTYFVYKCALILNSNN